jgi:hypothetical protein
MLPKSIKFLLEVCWQFLAKQSSCKERELALLPVLELMPHNAKCTGPVLFSVLEMTMLGSIKTFSNILTCFCTIARPLNTKANIDGSKLKVTWEAKRN